MKLIDVITSQVGRKVLTGLTGLALCGFVVGHLLGNLQLFVGPELFNSYALKLESLGPILWVVELILLWFFAMHAAIGTSIALKKQKAKPVKYAVSASAGQPSKQSASSKSMIVTGTILLVFTILHVITFKFGPGIKEGYITTIHGEEARDLYKLVIEKFSNPLYAFGYAAVMALLGLHLRHGFWSAFQSLGLNNKKYSPFIYTAALIFAVLMAVGFIVLPIWIFLTKGGM
ncbi:MAG: succinate dehydrogenase cytochrome b subunit [Candidatus Sericytochromatia bacterium]